MATTVPKPPRTEIGAEYPTMRIGTEPERAYLVDEDFVPELVHPLDIPIYSAMVTDGQVHGLEIGITGPIHRYRWSLDPAGADEEDTRRQAKSLGLPVYGQDVGPRAQLEAFTFNKILARILLALRYRYYHFEIVGKAIENGRGPWVLDKLAGRPPWTLAYDGIHADRHGDLVSIQQQLGVDDKPIPASQVAAFVWGEEEGGFIGKSMLRPLYTNWWLKKTLLKVDTINHELNGAGTAVATGAEGTQGNDKATLLAAGNSMRAAPHRAVYIPHGTTLTRQGIQGSVTDPIASVRYHDEQMSKATMQMVIDLAQTSNGSRGLSETFADILLTAQGSIAGWVAATFTQQVLAKVTALNYGPGTPCPILRFDHEESPELAIADLAMLVEKGVITPDPELEEAVRTKHGLPKRSTASPVVTPAPTQVAASIRAAAMLPDRKLRRDPFEQEIRAAVDYAALDTEHLTSQAAIAKVLLSIREDLGAYAVLLIGAMPTVDNAALPDLLAPALTEYGQALDLAVLVGLIEAAAQAGASQVKGEAARQGAQVDLPTVDYTALAVVEANGLVGRVARQVADTAGTAARVAVPASATPPEVAAAAATQIEALTPALVERAAGGAAARAQLAGRVEALEVSPYRDIYASELLDANTCGPCRAIDGTRYDTIEEAMRDYPAGGFAGCEGMENCRGTLVAIMDTEQEAAT